MNNAEIGSHIKFYRKPDIFDRVTCQYELFSLLVETFFNKVLASFVLYSY